MGGFIATTLIRRGKTTHRILPKQAASWINTASFFKGEGDFWDEWKRGERHSFVPYGYGILVINIDEKWVVGCQDYCGLHEGRIRVGREGDEEEFSNLWKEGRITEVSIYAPGNNILVPLPKDLSCDPGKVLTRAYQKMGSRAGGTIEFEVEFPEGWQVSDNNDDNEGWDNTLITLDSKGRAPSGDTLEQWKAYFDDHQRQPVQMHAFTAREQAMHISQATRQVSTRETGLTRKRRL